MAEEYITLVEVLTTMLADKEELDDAASTKALEIGRRWARTAGADASNGALDTLFATLRDMGFDPATKPDSTDIELHACPFVSSGLKPSPFCARYTLASCKKPAMKTPLLSWCRASLTTCRLEIKPA